MRSLWFLGRSHPRRRNLGQGTAVSAVDVYIRIADGSSLATVTTFSVPTTLTTYDALQQYDSRSQKRIAAAVWNITFGGLPVVLNGSMSASRTDCKDVISALMNDTEGFDPMSSGGG